MQSDSEAGRITSLLNNDINSFKNICCNQAENLCHKYTEKRPKSEITIEGLTHSKLILT